MIFRKPGTIIPPSNWIQFTLTVHQPHCQRKLYYNVDFFALQLSRAGVRFFLFCLFSCMFLFVCVCACVCVRVRAIKSSSPVEKTPVLFSTVLAK